MVTAPTERPGTGFLREKLVAGDVHPAHLAQIAASLKARVKGITEAERRSGFAFERRTVCAARTIVVTSGC